MYCHATAIIDAGAQIGDGTKIWHFCHVMGGARIGTNCTLGQNVYVANQVVVGNGVKIQNNVSLFDGVNLEDDVFCGPSVVFTNVRTPRSAHPRRKSYSFTIVKKGASIGANSTIVCGVTLGEHSFIAAGAVVTKDVPPFALIAGVPGRQIGWVSEAGMTLHFDESSHARCPETKQVYKLIDQKFVQRIS